MIKVIELFGGIGACTQAMKRIGIDFEVVDYVEIDKYAVKSYNAINGTNYEPQDITEWDKDIEVDLLVGGFPCQDISVAGLGKGIVKGETRSGLMYEMMRIIEKTKPQYVIAENVKNLLSKKFRPQLEEYLCFLSEQGYEVTMDVLNAKEFGVPQSRERVFIMGMKHENGNANRGNMHKVCKEILESLEEQGKIQIANYQFPEKQELTIRLKDILEDEVDEKYYISSDKVEKLVKQIVEKQGDKGLGALLNNCILDDTNSEQFGNCRLYKDNAPSLRSQRQGQKVVEIEPVIIGGQQKNQAIKTDGVCTCLTSAMGDGGGYVPLKAEIEQVGNIVSTGNFENPQRGRIYSSDGICPALNCMRGGGLEPKIIECEKITCYSNYKNVDKVNTQVAKTLCARDYKGFGTGWDTMNSVLEVCPIPTLTGQDRHGVVLMLSESDYFLVSIRKLTPKECWRLMGFSDDVFELAEEVNSRSQLYKQAGNSIVVDVLVGIIGEIESMR